MNMVGMSIGKRGRQKYLPLEVRIRMHDDVIELRKKGLTQKEIQGIIYEKYEMWLPQSTISYWINRKHNPLEKLNKFDEKPSPKLSYVIGVMLGDGSKYFDNKNYRLELSVKDYEFAEEFGKNLAEVLKKNKPYKPFWNKNKKLWTVEVRSILLYKFLDKPLRKLKPYIEYSMDCIAKFLMALFDGEGGIYVNKKRYKRELRLYNTNEELLNYAKYLLKKYFDIDVTGPHLMAKRRTIIRIPNGNCKSNKDCYYLHIRVNSILNFYKSIGFMIRRKQRKLIEATKQ